MDELQELREAAARDVATLRKKTKELYRYARDKGFTYAEARRLAATSREKIDRLAALKEKG